MKYILFCIVLISNITFAQRADFKHIDLTRADNLASLNKGASLDNLAVLTYNLTSQLATDVEKFRAIYYWICDNIKGDPNQHNIVADKRRIFKNNPQAFSDWNQTYRKIALEKLLKKKKTMCSGYAYLLKEMCVLANLECEIVNGYIRTIYSNVFALDSPNHSWNAIKLNNKWYLCDATWSSGYMKGGVEFIKEFNDGYFLAQPELFAISHQPFNKKWLLIDELITSEFKAGPLVYEETFKHNVLPLLPEDMRINVTKNDTIHFKLQFSNPLPLSKVALVKRSKTQDKELTISNAEIEGDTISFNYQFIHKGLHDVHLRIGKDIVATYTVKVVNQLLK